MFDKLINWFEKNQQPCFYKKYFGIECPGCGMQRAFVELLKGNIFESIAIYPALLPMVFLFIFTFLHLKFNYKHGALIIKITFITIVLLIVSTYFYKMISTNIL